MGKSLRIPFAKYRPVRRQIRAYFLLMLEGVINQQRDQWLRSQQLFCFQAYP